MATPRKQERDLVALKSHDGFDVGDRLHVVGDPDERTTHLIDQGYFGWADEPQTTAGVQAVGQGFPPAPSGAGADAGNQ